MSDERSGPEVEPILDPYGARSLTVPPARELGLDADRALDRATTLRRRYWAV
jgi:hypothetical protein